MSHNDDDSRYEMDAHLGKNVNEDFIPMTNYGYEHDESNESSSEQSNLELTVLPLNEYVGVSKESTSQGKNVAISETAIKSKFDNDRADDDNSHNVNVSRTRVAIKSVNYDDVEYDSNVNGTPVEKGTRARLVRRSVHVAADTNRESENKGSLDANVNVEAINIVDREDSKNDKLHFANGKSRSELLPDEVMESDKTSTDDSIICAELEQHVERLLCTGKIEQVAIIDFSGNILIRSDGMDIDLKDAETILRVLESADTSLVKIKIGKQDFRCFKDSVTSFVGRADYDFVCACLSVDFVVIGISDANSPGSCIYEMSRFVKRCYRNSSVSTTSLGHTS